MLLSNCDEKSTGSICGRGLTEITSFAVVFKLPNLIPGQRFCDLIHFRHEQGVRFNHIFGLEIPL